MASMDALQVGMAAVHLGAGRNRAEDHVDPSVGFVLAKKPGDYVEVGDVLAWVHASSHEKADVAVLELRDAVRIGTEISADLLPLWLDVVH